MTYTNDSLVDKPESEQWPHRVLEENLRRCTAVRVRRRRPTTSSAFTPVGMLFESDADWEGVRPGDLSGDFTVLLSPPDVTRRRHVMSRGVTNRLRPFYWVDPDSLLVNPINPEFCNGARVVGDIKPAQLAFPASCWKCRKPRTHGLVLEALVPTPGRPSWRYELAEQPASQARRQLECKEVAEAQRIWCAVPSCAAHATKAMPATLASSANGKLWISFHNERYGSEFGAMNGLRPRHPMFHILSHWLSAMIAVIPLLFYSLFLAGALRHGDTGFLVAMLAITLIFLLWVFGRMPLHRARASRGSPAGPIHPVSIPSETESRPTRNDSEGEVGHDGNDGVR